MTDIVWKTIPWVSISGLSNTRETLSTGNTWRVSKDRGKLFSLVSCIRIKGNGHQLIYKRFCLNIRGKTSLEFWLNRLLRDVGESASLKIPNYSFELLMKLGHYIKVTPFYMLFKRINFMTDAFPSPVPQEKKMRNPHRWLLYNRAEISKSGASRMFMQCSNLVCVVMTPSSDVYIIISFQMFFWN